MIADSGLQRQLQSPFCTDQGADCLDEDEGEDQRGCPVGMTVPRPRIRGDQRNDQANGLKTAATPKKVRHSLPTASSWSSARALQSDFVLDLAVRVSLCAASVDGARVTPNLILMPAKKRLVPWDYSSGHDHLSVTCLIASFSHSTSL